MLVRRCTTCCATTSAGRRRTAGLSKARRARDCAPRSACWPAKPSAATATRRCPRQPTLELVHNYSLIHDDIQDRDLERRHQPTVWAIWGEAQAINAGSAMRQLAGLTLRKLVPRGVSPERASVRHGAGRRDVSSTARRPVAGHQLRGAAGRRSLRVSRHDFAKDGRPAWLRRRAGRAPRIRGRRAAAFQRFGRNLGLAFQIRDDALGIWGDGDETGKPAGSDIRRKKKSFPIICALQEPSPAAEELRRIYAQPQIDEEQVATVLDLLDSLGVREATRRTAEALPRPGAGGDGAALAAADGAQRPRRAGALPGGPLALKER